MKYNEVSNAQFVKGFIRLAKEGYLRGWHERNGGNLSYHMTGDDAESVMSLLNRTGDFIPIGAKVPALGGEYFLVTGSGKYFGNVEMYPEDTCAIIELDSKGENYRIVWGLTSGGRPTSELPSHLMNHESKFLASGGTHRVIYHAHPSNLIALTFVLPLSSEVFSHYLWEMMTECPVIFPDGVGVIEWMVPGGEEIAKKSAALMKDFNAVVWAHHGLFCSGEDFDLTFGLFDTIEKAAGILVKVLSMGGIKQTITDENFRDLSKAFGVTINPSYLH